MGKKLCTLQSLIIQYQYQIYLPICFVCYSLCNLWDLFISVNNRINFYLVCLLIITSMDFFVRRTRRCVYVEVLYAQVEVACFCAVFGFVGCPCVCVCVCVCARVSWIVDPINNP